MKLPVLRVFNLYNIVLLILVMIQFYFFRALTLWTEPFIPPLNPLSLGFDSMIRQTPVFIIPYLSVYLLLILVMVLIVMKREIFDMTKFLISVLLLWSVINFLQSLFPIYNSRPQIGETNWFIDYLSELTRPYRTLPRWHAATAILCAIAYTKMNFNYSKFVIAWGALICLSPIFLKMTFITEIFLITPLPFLCYMVAEKISSEKIKVETVQEVVKIFTLDSLIKSVVIGIRDESTLSSLIEGLTRLEKSLTDKDREEIKNAGRRLTPPVESLKNVINNLILSLNLEKRIERAKEMSVSEEKSFIPSDKDINIASEELINNACKPFENSDFRELIIEIKKRNSQTINVSSIEEAALDRSMNIINKFKMFIEIHEHDIPALKSIINNTNGTVKYSLDDVRTISSELRKPPYELSSDEIWNAFYRIDKENVKPIKEFRTQANIISLTRFAAGKIKVLEPFSDRVEKKFNELMTEYESGGRKFSEEEHEWLLMMKKYITSNLEIKMESFDEEPFFEKGGAKKAYNIFGMELKEILSDFNTKLIY